MLKPDRRPRQTPAPRWRPAPLGRSAPLWRALLLIVIMLTAAALRLYALPDVPPGMTHDEADHGVDAWGVVNGIRPLYFSVGYGREPLFDYATAGLMAFLGPTYLAGRLTAVFFSLLLLAATYAWTRRAFGETVALLSVAAQAVNFWATMTARHALRSVTMPALFTLAMLCYWRALERPDDRRHALAWALPAGLLLGGSFYTYMPARLTWLVLPALLIAWALWQRAALRAHWRATLVTLVTAGLVAAPLFVYLAVSGAEQRLDQLSGPIDALLTGDWQPLAHNARAGLSILTFYGDAWTWRYNIPGRPLLTPVLAVLFYAGLLLALVALARRRNLTAHVAALSWLALGLAPVLITGPDASTTRAIAIQPVLFLYLALALAALWRRLSARAALPAAAGYAGAALLFGALTFNTANAYFVTWANHPEVRVHYETTRVTAIDYLNAHGAGVAAISSPQPDRFHDPAVAAMTLRNPAVSLRWFNGQAALLLPNAADATLVYSGWTAAPPALAALLPAAPDVTLPLRPDDLDRPITIYTLDGGAWAGDLLAQRFVPLAPPRFGTVADLLGYQLRQTADQIELLTFWQVQTAADDLKLFTHLRATADRPPAAQADRLDAPSAFWQPGDYFIQLHHLALTPDLAAGPYTLAVGLYSEPQPGLYERLPVTRAGQTLGDAYEITTVTLP